MIISFLKLLNLNINQNLRKLIIISTKENFDSIEKFSYLKYIFFSFSKFSSNKIIFYGLNFHNSIISFIILNLKNFNFQYFILKK